MLAVSADLIHDELVSARQILDKWSQRVDAGLPVVDAPGSVEQLDLLVREMAGELRVCAGKCGNLAEILLGG